MAESDRWDVVVIGAGAAGLMCAAEIGFGGKRVLLLEKGRKAGRKILISGGGRCNFTNIHNDPRKHYLSENPHFCVSALRRYPASAFIEMVEEHGIAYHEKTLGQLFCDGTSAEIVGMLLARCDDAGGRIWYNAEAASVAKTGDGFCIGLADAPDVLADQVVVASGGLSIPKLVTDFSYRAAATFDMPVLPLRAGLVPFTWNNRDREVFAQLSGVSLPARASANGVHFDESLLFTHRGLSGPVILQVSSYWEAGQPVVLNLLPEADLAEVLRDARSATPKVRLKTCLGRLLPNRLVEAVEGIWFEDTQLGQLSKAAASKLADQVNRWAFKPGGTEGYRTAEVTLGGISTDVLSSRTLACKSVPGLYFIGEAVDVTGHLGGHNFQWAWASGYAAAQAICEMT